MTAATHTWRRMRRWYVLACWRARGRQLDTLIPQLDAEIASHMALLAALQFERRALQARIDHATRPVPKAVAPITWGL